MPKPRKVSGRIFSALPMTWSTSGMSAKRSRLDLRGAAGDDEARGRVLAPQLADGLRGLAHGLGGHGAGVDDDGVAEPGRGGMARITSDS